VYPPGPIFKVMMAAAAKFVHDSVTPSTSDLLQMEGTVWSPSALMIAGGMVWWIFGAPLAIKSDVHFYTAGQSGWGSRQ